MEKLAIGKIPDKDLSRILEKYTNSTGTRVLLGPKLGEDAGIIDMGRSVSPDDNCLCVCVDPIMIDIKNAPYYAVAVNVNDIVTRGAVPKWASASVFFPQGSTLETVERFFFELYAAIKPHNISIVTGHTEITTAVRNPGIVLTMLGEVSKADIVTTGGAKEGDMLILTGGAGIEGTSLIANELGNDYEVEPNLLERAKNFITEPGICIAEAAYLAKRYRPNAMHDPTEGGVLKGIEEIAIASDKGVVVYRESIPIREETRAICEKADVDPLAIFGSGALLVSIPEENGRRLLEEYSSAGILAADIGRIVNTEMGRKIVIDGSAVPLEASHIDGLIWRLSER